MKKILLLIITLLMLFSTVSCSQNKSVAEAIREIDASSTNTDKSDKYDLDERFDYFQLFSVGAESVLHLKAETGILSIKFNTSEEKEDGSVDCTVTGLYLQNVGTIAFGWLEKIDIIKQYIGEDLVFTLYLNENNVVTTDDLPAILPEYIK